MNNADNHKMVSIIIPVYNVAPFLKRCMNSVIRQTFLNTEIILIDDGSSDESGVMCDEFAKKDSKIKVFHTQNRGLCEARNYGLNKSSGDFITFIDSDDYVSLNYIEALYNRITDTKADFVQCRVERRKFGKENTTRSDEKITEINEPGKVMEPVDYLRKVLNKKESLSVWGKLFKRDVAETVLMPAGRFHEDSAVIVKYVEASSKIATEPRAVYYYMPNRPGSITTSFSRKKICDLIWAKKVMYADCSKYFPELLEDAKKRYLRAYIFIWMITVKSYPFNVLLFCNTGKTEERYAYYSLLRARKIIKRNLKSFFKMPLNVRIQAFLICYAPMIYMIYVKTRIKLFE